VGSPAPTASWLGKASRGLDVWRRSGTGTLLRLAGDRLINRVIRASLIDVVMLERAAHPGALPGMDGFATRFLGPDEIRRFAADPANDIRPSFAESALAAHHLCFAALAGDRLAAYGWYALDSIGAEHAFGVALAYPEDVAYMFKGFTHPEHRGARLHGALMALALRRLADQGVSKLVSLVDWTNTASLRSCQRIGYVRLGRLGVIQLPGHQVLRVPRQATRRGIRFGPAARAPARPQPPAATRERAA
jgi:hypothetical protein